jgi:hypothetical protein
MARMVRRWGKQFLRDPTFVQWKEEVERIIPNGTSGDNCQIYISY